MAFMVFIALPLLYILVYTKFLHYQAVYESLQVTHNFIAANHGTNLIVIDTLEYIRNGEQTSNIYACNYHDMNCLQEITGRHPLTLLFIHHTRCMTPTR